MPSDYGSTDYQRRGGTITWGDVDQAINYLVHTMEYNHYRPQTILGLSRGGLVPAVLLSHKLEAQGHKVEVKTLAVSSYEGREAKKVRIELPFAPKLVGLNFFQFLGAFASAVDKTETLILDDLWDTGGTMDVMQDAFPFALKATLFHKSEAPQKLPPINFPGLWCKKDEWLTMPWEA